MTDGTVSGGDKPVTGGEEDDAGDARRPGSEKNAYGGVVGAFPYAFRASDSWVFRVYAAGGGFLAALVVVLFGLSLVVLVGKTAGVTGGTFTFSRAFLLVVMVLVVVPLVAPVLFVARRHRRVGSTVSYDQTLAGTGYLFVLALYVGLVVSAPDSLTDDPGSPVGAVVAWLYSLPQWAGAVPPFLAAVMVYAAHRRLR